MPIRKAQWKNDAQFDYGTPIKDKVEIVGSGDSAYLALTHKAIPTDHVTFTTPANYAYDPTKIVVTGGVAKLLATVINDQNWPFTIPGNYTYDGAKIEVVGGKAQLKGSPITCYAQWHMNEASGVNVPDSSGNGYDGTCVNMEDSDWVPGKLNNCLRFGEGGDREYVDCGNVGGFDRLDAFSFEFWLKTTSVSWPTFVGKMIPTSNRTGYEAGFQSGVLRLRLIRVLNINSIVVRNNTPVSDGMWHHIIITYDGSSSASGVKFYVDGGLCGGNIVDHDNLTGSILNSSSLWLGYRTSTSYFDGSLDEVVIYDKELNVAEIAERWNSGNGSELMPGAFPIGNPPIVPNASMAFTAALGHFAETATKPAGTALKYHLSSDNGATWEWWSGAAWVPSDGTYAQANIATEVNSHINSLAGAGTFKFRALLHTDDGSATPELDNVYLGEGVSFPLGSFEVAMDFDVQPAAVYNWLSLVETIAVPANTELKRQWSTDGGASWNGMWLTGPQLEAAVQGISLVGDGSDTLRFKFQLTTTDILQTPEVDDLALTYSTGHENAGSYTSVVYVPAGSYLNGLFAEEITFSVVTPAGTSLVVRARVVDHILEENYDKPWTAYNSGNTIAICGTLIQFEAELTTTDASKTPRLNWVEIGFHLLIGLMRSIDETVVSTETKIIRLLGLNHENAFIDNTDFDVMNQLIACRVRLYNSKTNAEAAQDGDNYVTGLVATYTVEAVHEGEGKLKTYRYVKSP